MARPKKYRNEQERKKARREAARVRRESRKQDPFLKELDKETERRRYRKRVKDGKIKMVSALSNREKRQKRKMWRRNTKNYRIRKCILDTLETPPNTPAFLGGSSSTRSGRKRRAFKRRAKAYRDNDKLRAININLKKQVDKYRKRYERLKEKKNPTGTQIIPRTRATMFLATNDKNKVRKKLIFGEVLKDQLTKSYKRLKSVSSKQIFTKLLGGDLLMKYRLLKEAGEFFSYETFRINGKRNTLLLKYERNLRFDALKNMKIIKVFLEMDENSWLCPGKRDVVRRNGVVKQKRFLTDTLRNLYTKFLKTSNIKISYASFCKFQPFNIVTPKAKDRETCLCTIHKNFKLILKSLHDHKVIPSSNPECLVAAVCCPKEEEDCLKRVCKHRNIPSLMYDDNYEVNYFQWTRTTESITTKNSTKKSIKIIVKKEMRCSLKYLLNTAKEKLQSFLCHTNNIRHQQTTFRLLRKSPSENDLCIHIDFSENYLCKYSREPQSVHFGGSKKQLTLHTGVAYCEQGKMSFATVSEDLRHDAKAVVAHLYPILIELLERFKNVKRINFISDGPTSQYKNKTIFSAIGTILPALFPTINELTWNYSESGHGKGPADGIGGTLKRTADRVVAHQNDIIDVTSFLNRLKLSTLGILLKHVTPDDIKEMDCKITNSNLIKTVKGSNQAHQVTWRRGKNELHFNSLSCLICKSGSKCLHYSLACVPLATLPIEMISHVDDDQLAMLPSENEHQPATPEDENVPISSYEDDNIQSAYLDIPVPTKETLIQAEPFSSIETQPIFTQGPCEEGDWIVVAYEDTWYPGIVENINGDALKVSYMERKADDSSNLFYWPLIADRH